jgi:predicted dehydrogenase
MKRVRLGAAGLGGIFYGWGGHSGHLPCYPRLDEARLCALCDANQANLEKAVFWFKRAYEEEAQKQEEAGNTQSAARLREDAETVKAYTAYERMIEEESLDLVDIMTPPKFHAPMAIEALEKGTHVICEKPMARSWLEAMDIVEAVEKSDCLFKYAENFVYSLSWYNLRKFISSGIIGEPVAIFLPLAIGEPGALTSSYWDPMVGGGGSLMDMAIHGITSTWFLVGFDAKPVRVKSAEPDGIGIKMPERLVDGVYQRVTAEDEAHFLIEFERESGWTTVFIEGSWSYRDSCASSVILGTKGSIEFGSGDKMTLIDPHGNRKDIPYWSPSFLHRTRFPEPGGYYGELQNIVKCIIGGTRPSCDERIGAESLAIAGAAYLSEIRGRQPVSVEEFKQYALQIKQREGSNATEALIRELTVFGGGKQ